MVLGVLRESSSLVAVMGFREVLLSFLLLSVGSWCRGAVITGVRWKFLMEQLNVKVFDLSD